MIGLLRRSFVSALGIVMILAEIAVARPDGFTTTFVTFEGGLFVRLADGSWGQFERDASSPYMLFDEAMQGPWTIDLEEQEGDLVIRLDMERRMISHSTDSIIFEDLWIMTNAFDRVGGLGVSFIETGNGWFETEGDGLWSEIDANGKDMHQYRETGRDQWSVMLKDDKRDLFAQFDMYRRTVRTGKKATALTDQRRIQYAQ